MKKYLLSIISSFFVCLTVYAFTPATLKIETWEGLKKVAVYSQAQVDKLFQEGYTLDYGNLGTSITTINSSDTLKNSRTTINDNFTALNNGKIETSTTTLPLITTLANLATVGTITSGTWNGTAISVAKGGTGTTSPALNYVILGDATNGFKTVSGLGTSGQLLTSAGAGNPPVWGTPSVDTATNYTWTGIHNFSATTTFSSIVNAFTASTTITATIPVPVYLATSTNALMLSTASTTATNVVIDYLGFALNNGTNGSTVYVQTYGVVSGFTDLTPGAVYYVQNTAGTIGTTVGVNPIRVGRAVSATQLLIDRQRIIGTYSPRVNNTTYYAYTDGIVTFYATKSFAAERCIATVNSAQVIVTDSINDKYTGGSFPVKLGDVWKVNCDATPFYDSAIRWNPIN